MGCLIIRFFLIIIIRVYAHQGARVVLLRKSAYKMRQLCVLYCTPRTITILRYVGGGAICLLLLRDGDGGRVGMVPYPKSF